MADVKYSELIEILAPDENDIASLTTDPAGTPASNYAKLINIVKSVTAIGVLTVEGNATATAISLSSTDFTNKVQFDQFDSAGLSVNMTPEVVQNHIKVDKAGVYVVAFVYSFSGGSNDTYSGAVYINNGATKLNTRSTRKLGTGGDVGVALLLATGSLVANDTIEPWFQNESGTADFTIEDGIMLAFRII